MRTLNLVIVFIVPKNVRLGSKKMASKLYVKITFARRLSIGPRPRFLPIIIARVRVRQLLITKNIRNGPVGTVRCAKKNLKIGHLYTAQRNVACQRVSNTQRLRLF